MLYAPYGQAPGISLQKAQRGNTIWRGDTGLRLSQTCVGSREQVAEQSCPIALYWLRLSAPLPFAVASTALVDLEDLGKQQGDFSSTRATNVAHSLLSQQAEHCLVV